ncbi:hypothetical protein V8E36_004131 [Tilletia maclaganii]
MMMDGSWKDRSTGWTEMAPELRAKKRVKVSPAAATALPVPATASSSRASITIQPSDPEASSSSSSPPPASSSSAPTASQFHQVTDPAFTSLYQVPDIHPRASVFYNESFISHNLAHEWKTRCQEELQWYRPTLRVYGRDVIQSRQIAAYATTSDLKLTYSGHPVEMHHPFPPILTEIASHLERILTPTSPSSKKVHFNHVMANMYEDGSKYIGKHRDNRENLCIATVSLGAERRWVMERVKERKSSSGKAGGRKRKAEKLVESLPQRKEWTLKNGSLLVMQGDTQQLYTHEIPKEPKVKDLRISLTFRQLINKQ